ncbi:MAG: hypothetical protein QOK44_247, partial [Betaproteobacteria bacterium]|nr:hypothetical protein [Betaproteobacteria bacterium]
MTQRLITALGFFLMIVGANAIAQDGGAK